MDATGPEEDAALDASRDAATPSDAGLLQCRRLCRSPQAFTRGEAVARTVAPHDGDARNVVVGRGVRIGDDVLFSFTADTCCMEEETRAGGVVRFTGDAIESVALYGPEPLDNIVPDSDPFATPAGAGFLIGNGALSTVAVVDPSSLEARAPIDVGPLALDEGPLIPPAFLPREGGYLLLRGPAARFELLDPELGSLAPPHDLGLDVGAVTLVETCSAIVALFATNRGELYTLAFDPAGTPLTDAPVLVSASLGPALWRTRAVWDGAAITMVGLGVVIELDEMGNLLGETPAPDAVAAVGTDEGLLCLEGRADTPPGGRDGARVVLRERTSGATVRDLGAIDVSWYLTEGAMGLADGRVDVLATSFAIRNEVRGVSIACE
jgi:hypothetical protein